MIKKIIIGLIIAALLFTSGLTVAYGLYSGWDSVTPANVFNYSIGLLTPGDNGPNAEEQLAEAQAELLAKNAAIAEKDLLIEEKNATIAANLLTIEGLNADIAQLEANELLNVEAIAALQTQKEALQAQIVTLEEDATANATQIASLQAEVDLLDAAIVTLEAEKLTAIDAIATLNAEVVTLNTQITTLQSEVTTLNATVASLQADIIILNAEIAALQAQIAILEQNQAGQEMLDYIALLESFVISDLYFEDERLGSFSVIEGNQFELSDFNTTIYISIVDIGNDNYEVSVSWFDMEFSVNMYSWGDFQNLSYDIVYASIGWNFYNFFSGDIIGHFTQHPQALIDGLNSGAASFSLTQQYGIELSNRVIVFLPFNLEVTFEQQIAQTSVLVINAGNTLLETTDVNTDFYIELAATLDVVSQNTIFTALYFIDGIEHLVASDSMPTSDMTMTFESLELGLQDLFAQVWSANDGQLFITVNGNDYDLNLWADGQSAFYGLLQDAPGVYHNSWSYDFLDFNMPINFYLEVVGEQQTQTTTLSLMGMTAQGLESTWMHEVPEFITIDELFFLIGFTYNEQSQTLDYQFYIEDIWAGSYFWNDLSGQIPLTFDSATVLNTYADLTTLVEQKVAVIEIMHNGVVTNTVNVIDYFINQYEMLLLDFQIQLDGGDFNNLSIVDLIINNLAFQTNFYYYPNN